MSTQSKSKLQTGNFFEDFRVGQEFRHATPRTLTEADAALNVGLYGSRFAVNSSDVFARAIGAVTLRDNVWLEVSGGLFAGSSLDTIGRLPSSEEVRGFLADSSPGKRGRLADLLLQNGRYPAIATHDPTLIAHVRDFTAQHGIGADRFEFQMLYGIRRDLQASLLGQGYHVRVYVPFGKEWFPYFMRRLGERPENVGFVVRALLHERRRAAMHRV